MSKPTNNIVLQKVLTELNPIMQQINRIDNKMYDLAHGKENIGKDNFQVLMVLKKHYLAKLTKKIDEQIAELEKIEIE